MSENKITNIVRVGIDIAKLVFQVHGVDKYGKVCIQAKISRHKLLQFTAQLRPCLIGMEACGGAHYWATEFQKQGHKVGLMAGHRVKSYVTSGNKDDKVDAAAICEAVGRPTMIFIPCKSQRQLEIQALHRHREQLSKLVNILSNQIRGLLLEHGLVIPIGVNNITKKVPGFLEDADNGLSGTMRILIQKIYNQFKETEHKLADVNKTIELFCKEDETCRRICKIPGIGPITATALYAAIGNGRQFKNGRGAAAWLGIIPRHSGSGGKTINGKLSRKGNRYIKTLAIQGGRSIVQASKRKNDKRSVGINALQNRKGNNITAVACAHRNIRIAWALMARNEEYKQAA